MKICQNLLFLNIFCRSKKHDFDGIDSCVNLRFHLAKTREIEAGKSHENFIQVANGHLVNYSYFLRTDDALTGHAGTVSHTSCKRLAFALKRSYPRSLACQIEGHYHAKIPVF